MQQNVIQCNIAEAGKDETNVGQQNLTSGWVKIYFDCK